MIRICSDIREVFFIYAVFRAMLSLIAVFSELEFRPIKFEFCQFL